MSSRGAAIMANMDLITADMDTDVTTVDITVPTTTGMGTTATVTDSDTVMVNNLSKNRRSTWNQLHHRIKCSAHGKHEHFLPFLIFVNCLRSFIIPNNNKGKKLQNFGI